VDVNAAGDSGTDADIVFVIFGKNGEAFEDGITVALSRDATGTGSNERPSINNVPVGAAPLVIGEWYQFDFTLDWSESEAAFSITRLSNGSSFATGTTGFLVDTIDMLQLEGDIAGGERLNDAGTVADFSLAAGNVVVAMNPAHMLYEALTNTSWGTGGGTAQIDDTNFRAAADTFYSEGLGLCMHWTQQESVEAFMQRVVDHAGAALVQNPTTGLFEIVAFRGGYDVGSLPLFDESNIQRVESYQKPAPAETTNEVVVKFGDVGSGPRVVGTQRAQNLANITSQGGVVTRTQQYPGLFHAALALRVAMRDLKAVSSPQAKVRLRVQRKAFSLTRGSVIRWNWAKLSITGMVLRVLRINYGSLTDGTIELECAEDVYSMPATTYGAEQPSGWTPPAGGAAVVAQNRLVREAGYYEAVQVFGATEVAARDPAAGFVVAAAVRPSGLSLDYGMRTRTGAEAYVEVDRGGFAPSGTLSAALGHAATTATIANIVDGAEVAVGTYAQVGDEIVRVDAWDSGTGAITLGRGVHGTVAASHASGARIFFIDGYTAFEENERADGDDVDVKLLPRTGQGELAEGSAQTDSVVIDQLILRPYAPGRLRINALAYPTSVAAEDVTITWRHRDRLLQALEGDEAADTGPEDGVTYSVEVVQADDDDLIVAADGIVGTSYVVDDTLFASDIDVKVRLWAVKAPVDAMPLRSAFEVTRELADLGETKITWRFLLASGWVDVVQISTVSNFYFQVRRYSAVGELEASVYAYRVSGAAYDASADVVVVGVYSLGTDPLTTPSEAWVFDVAAAGLTKVEITPDFPAPSGVEIISVAAAGGSIYAVNYDGSRVLRYNTAGVEQDREDDTLSRVFSCDGTHLVFALANGFKRRNASTLVQIEDKTFSPSATRIGKFHLVGGELVFIGDPSAGGLSTLYRYNATTAARIASHADVPYGASGSPNDLQAFAPYLSTGETGEPKVFDTTDWSIVLTAGAAVPLASAQRHDYTLTVTTAAGPVASGWNPADKDADITLSVGDTVATLVSTGTQGGVVRGTQARPATEDRCFMITYAGPDGRCCGGIATASASLTSYPGQDAQGYGYYGVDGRSQHNGSSSAYGSTYGNGAQVLYRLNAGTLTAYLWTGAAWTSQGNIATGLTGNWYPAWGPGSVEAGTRSATIDTDNSAWPAGPPGGSTPWG
ncbi:phage tail protein, partial [Luteitalea sp.]|uniref:phage tail protein n=1 Tax=Luteitalea sp. TaxID=2004800 RepID=UPI0025B8DE6D